MTKHSNEPKRKPGGQPGNQNARTHGYYSQQPTPAQQRAILAAAGVEGLDYELALVRTKILSILAADPQNHKLLFTALGLLVRLTTASRLTAGSTRQRQVSIADVLAGLSLPPELKARYLGGTQSDGGSGV
jgi:hypothetical protein